MSAKKDKSKKIKPEVLKGFRDYIPAEEIARQKLVSVFREVFESFGFSPLQTPSLEKIETLKGSDYGSDNLETIFSFTGPEKVDMALRFELTASLARYVAGNPELPLPFRRYQIGPVWRVDKPGPGRFRGGNRVRHSGLRPGQDLSVFQRSFSPGSRSGKQYQNRT